MRIAIVTETYPPEINGVALTVLSLVENLAALGHQVDLIRPRQTGNDPAPILANVDEILVGGLALPRYPGLRLGLPSRRVLERRWRERLPDALYIATEGPLGLSAMSAAERLAIPATTGFHTRFDEFLRHYGLGLLRPAAVAFLRRFHNRGAATLVPTIELKGMLERIRYRHVRVLPRGVDTALFSPARRAPRLRRAWGVDETSLAVLHVGRVAAEKNLDLVVRAFDALAAERPDARLIWVGDGPARAGLQRARPDFVFCGVQRGEELARHFASGDLFLFPSLTETFGNVTLEAMACGVPTVAFDYGAARAHLTDRVCGRAIDYDDSAAFVAAALELARDDDLRRQLRRNARMAVMRLSPQAVAAELVGLLDSLRPHAEAA